MMASGGRMAASPLVNNWIDFPSGSSAIEFGSSAVESCSLSRHNNIWYEAMSSESVDLLLKSVGEEEMISNKAINMDGSSKERFHDIDNHLDLQAEGDNTCNSSGMDVLPSNAELIQNKSEESFSGLHEGQMELQGSSQLEVESRTFLCVGPTKGEINSGGKIDGDQYMAEENDPDEHPASVVVASHSPDSITCGYNEGVKLVFASEKLSTGFLNEQHHGNISNLHGLLHENVQKESSLLVHSDENANDHSLPKLDALEMVKKKCSDSVISENSDGLFVATSCQDGNSSTGDEISGNDSFEKNFVSNDPVEDDDLHERRNQLIKSSNIVSGDAGQEVDACVNTIEKEQDREGKLDENNNSDVKNAIDPSNISKAVFNANYVSQGMEYKNYGQINTDPLNFTTENAGDGIEGNHTEDMDAEMQKSETKVSEHCKSYKEDKAVVDLSKAHVSRVDVSANSDASMLCSSPVKMNSGFMYKLMEKGSNLSPADLQTDECLSLDVSSIDKLIQFWYNRAFRNLCNITVCLKKIMPSYCGSRKERTNSARSNFASPIKSSKCQITVGTIGVEMNLSGASRLSNSRETVIVEMFNGSDSGAGCVREPLIDNSKERHSDTVMQPSSPVQSTDCTSDNEVPPSEGDALGDVKPLTHERDSTSHKLAVESFDGFHSMEAIPHVMNEVSVVSAQSMEPVPVGRQVEHASSPAEGSCSGEEPSNGQVVECNFGTKDVSNCHNLSEKRDGNTVESNPSEALIPSKAQSTNPFSCVHHFCGSMEAINYVGHAQDVSDHQEPKKLAFRSVNIRDLPESVADSEYKSCPELQPIDISEIPKENPQGFPEMEVDNFLTKTNKADHPKDVSRPSYGKKLGSRSKTKKEMHALKQSSEIEVKYAGGTSKSVGTSRKDMQLVEIHETSSSEFSSIKTSSFLTVQTSSIPDLNSSSLTSFHQPFTDLQQVQLRAQIFVYGALISGIPPDEAYGGRSLWESVWRVCISKFQNQKSPNSGYETPLHARSGGHVQSNIYNTSAAESPGKTLSSVTLSSTVPIPSHMWNLSSVDDKHVTSMSRGTYLNFSQTPSLCLLANLLQSRQNVGTNSSWFSQYPHLGPWFVTSQSSAPDGIAKYSMTPVAEAVHVTPVRETLGPHVPIPTMQVVPPSALMSAPDAKATTVATALLTQTTRRVEMSGSNRCNSTSQKSRKRKKDVAGDELIIQVSQTSGESVAAVGVVKSSSLPSTAMLMPSNSTARVGSCPPVSISMPEIFLPTHYNIVGDSGGQKKVIFSEETCSKIELAKLDAEDAAALADSTVKYSQAVWNQLAAQKNSELASEVELKLASAAVAVAAAASVAKAAAAAAKVAYDAALQAKIMADEAASAAKSGNTVQCFEHDIVNFGKILNESSIYAGKEVDKNPESGKVISAAREVARRRVESASAATKEQKTWILL
ncbi:hypothetical protein HPP92_022418 [Vanilla planifolia]|uniref:Uncharacterized protein n=1 Tax=Vanilla planifolia TaxID=51239 RepID=A0A835PRZ2_VANPL|nr:hypothetical protein HPP92_022418 [Vanilla planifolia]